MKKMGIEALYRKPRLSKPHPGDKVYPYLLREMEITNSNQVWATDITYLPMAKGFCYLVVIMDWASPPQAGKPESTDLEALEHTGCYILH